MISGYFRSGNTVLREKRKIIQCSEYFLKFTRKAFLKSFLIRPGNAKKRKNKQFIEFSCIFFSILG
jgi:hypothetical protein